MPPRLTVLLLASVILAGAAPPPSVPIYRGFGHWFVACDNTRECVARGFDEGTRAQLEFARPAGDAPGTLSFTAEDPFRAEELRVDGKPVAFPSPAWSTSDGTLTTVNPAAIRTFVDEVRDARVVTLDAVPLKGDEPRTVPLDGMTAALLMVDVVQGRPGTRTALIAPRGDATPPAALPVPAKPRWTRPPDLSRDETVRLLRLAGRLPSENFDCDSKGKPEVWALDADNALAIRPCYLAAYQGSSVVAVLPRKGGASRPLKLALPGVPDDATDGPDMVDPEFDPKTGTLSSSSKGRGLADCGSNEAWIWSAGRFRLVAMDYQEACGGTEPGDWPPLFRTR